MTDDELLRALRSVGFAAFVEHLALFDGPLSAGKAASALQEQTGWAASGCRTRVNRARAVLSAGKGRAALQLIATSDRVAEDIRRQALAALHAR